MRAGWGEADFRLVDATFLAAIRHALFAERGVRLLDANAEVRHMTGDDLEPNDKAKLVRLQLDAQAEDVAIREALFPQDDVDG